jgi:hypothetical protein
LPVCRNFLPDPPDRRKQISDGWSLHRLDKSEKFNHSR